jgi:SAM-dependent methyltransferase
MFVEASANGSTPEFWEGNWEGRLDLDRQELFCERSPIRPLLDRYVQPGSIMLEGGCGPGHYARYYGAQGVRVVALDFAIKTLQRLHAMVPDLVLTVGDVERLPLLAGSVDVYYSGGVVEHFEDGPSRALAEAFRVLKPGGTFLVSVPYFSPLRHVLRHRRPAWRVVDVEEPTPAPADLHFFQYVYEPSEFRRRLARAGFETTEEHGYSLVWGLYDLAGVRHALERRTNSTRSSAPPTAGTPVAEPLFWKARARAGAVRVGVTEDETVPILGPVIRRSKRLIANMMIYVAVKPAR